MGNRSFSFAPGEFYHVYNRGIEKRRLFLDHSDYKRFMESLYVVNTKKPVELREISHNHDTVYGWDRGEPIVAIGAYCLMPNHFHLLLTPRVDGGISSFMKKLGTSYSMYFNLRYERSGILFENKFKAKPVADDRYLKYLYSYIHLNPVELMQSDWKERGIIDPIEAYKFAASYRYSSLSDFLGKSRQESVILDPEPFPQYFVGEAERRAELLEWLRYGDGAAADFSDS
jgi:putative transposase